MALLARLLYDLQQLDLAIDTAERELHSLEAKLGEPEGLRHAREAWTNRQKESKDLAARLRAQELDLGELEEKISTTEATLYGGAGQTPKELASLQKEAELLRQRRGEIEEQALETMGQLEGAEKGAENLRRDYETLQATWKVEQGGLQAEIEKSNGQLAELKDKRATMVANIDPEALDTYEELRKRKGRVGVALVEAGICRGCRVDVPPSQQQEILRGQTLVHCSNCERILYLKG